MAPRRFHMYLFCLCFVCVLVTSIDEQYDPNGYVLYCPCMGRFGNQADHFLGALSFAKAVNRTLALPPWRTYRNVPFTEFFQVGPLQEYHRVIVMERFLSSLAPTYWPKGERRGYCWLPPGSKASCSMKDGNPFTPFWDELGVDFDNYVIFSIDFYTEDPYTKDLWHQQFPPSTHPVLAFRGAPARFPVTEHDRQLHRYLKWSAKIVEQVDAFINNSLPHGPFVGIHLRNGIDWRNACEQVEGSSNFMASPQCLGYTRYRTVTKSLCFPSREDILNQTITAVIQVKAKAVFVATDNDPMLEDLRSAFIDHSVSVVHLNPWLPQLDLAILGRAHHFIGNCVSSFTAFVKRERDVNGLPTSFFGYSNT